MPDFSTMDMSTRDINDQIHFFFLLDGSGSMYGPPIQTLNEAMSNVLPAIQDAANRKEITPIIHVLAFNSSVQWLCGTTEIAGKEAKDIIWHDISATGSTDTAGAINSIMEGLSIRHLGGRSFRPIIILITDGYSNDANATAAAVDKLVARQKSIRVAVGVNGYNPTELETFASAAKVRITDDLGNEVSAAEQKLIFPVDRADQLAYVIRDIAVSTLISSKLMGDTASGTTPTTSEGQIIIDDTPVEIEFVQSDDGEGVWL